MDIIISQDYINNLPVQKETVGNTQKTFRIDVTQCIAYEVNPKTLEWNGKYYAINIFDPDADGKEEEPLIPPEMIQEFETYDEPTSDEEPSPINQEDLEGEHDENQFWKTHKNHILIAAVVLLCVFAFRLFGAIKEKAEMINAELSSTEETFHGTRTAFEDGDTSTTQDVSAEEDTYVEATKLPPVTEEETISVLIAKSNILPGDTIDSSCLSYTQVPISEYESMEPSSYTDASDKDLLIGKIATKFFAANDLITFDDFSDTYQLQNPWDTGSPYYIDIPIDHTLAAFCPIGSRMDLTLRINDSIHYSSQSPTSYEGEGYYGTAAEDEKGNWIVTLTLEDITVYDCYNDKGTSLFSAYATFAQIPEEYLRDVLTDRYAKGTKFWREYPSYARIHLTPYQYDMIQALSDERAAILGIYEPATEAAAQADLYDRLSFVYEVLQERWYAKLGG